MAEELDQQEEQAQPEEPAAPQQPQEPPPWAEVSERFQRAFPNFDPAHLERRYNQAMQLRQARLRDDDQGDTGPERAVRDVARILPVVSHAYNWEENRRFANSQQAYSRGEANDDDLMRIATMERHQREEAAKNQGVGGLVQLGMHLPGQAAEFMLGGAALKALGIGAPALLSGSSYAGGRALLGVAGRTAAHVAVMSPAMGMLEDWQQRNLREGRSSGDLYGLPPALGVSMANLAVLGSLSKVTGGLERMLGISGTGLANAALRTPLRVAAGMAEQAAVDVGLSAAGLETGYGLIGDIMHGAETGNYDRALQHAAQQAMTFAAFAQLHNQGKPESRERAPSEALTRTQGEAAERESRGSPPPPVMEAFADALKTLKEQHGRSAQEAGPLLSAVHQHFLEEMRSNPNLTREQLRDIAGRIGDSSGEGSVLRKYAQTLAEHIPLQEVTAQEGEQGQLGAPSQRGTAAPAQESRTLVTPPPERRRLTGPFEAHIDDVKSVAQNLGLSTRGSRQEITDRIIKMGGGGFLDALNPRAKPPGGPESRPEPKGGQNPSEQVAPAAEGPPEGHAWAEEYARHRISGLSHGAAMEKANRTGEQVWKPTGTQFRDNPDGNRFDFTGSDGRTYTIEHQLRQPSEIWGEHGGAAVRVRNAEGDVVASASYKRGADGFLRGDVNVKTQHGKWKAGERLAPRGTGRAMYDYAHAAIGDIKPENTLHKSDEGKAMWQRNAEFAARRSMSYYLAASAAERGQSGREGSREPQTLQSTGGGGDNAQTSGTGGGVATGGPQALLGAAPVPGPAGGGGATGPPPGGEPRPPAKPGLVERMRAKQAPPTGEAPTQGYSAGEGAKALQALSKLAEQAKDRRIQGDLKNVAAESGVLVPKGKKELELGWRVKTMRKVLTDITDSPTPEGVDRLTRLVGGMERMARESGIDPHELVARELPDLAAALGEENIKTLINLSKEASDAIAGDTQRLAFVEAPFRRELNRKLQKEFEALKIPSPGQGVAGGGQSGPGAGPAQVRRASPQAGGEPGPPAPAGGGPADSNQLSPEQKMEKVRAARLETVLTAAKNRGGINRQSAIGLYGREFVVALEREIPSLFKGFGKDGKLRSGQRPMDELAEEMNRAGEIKTPESSHHHDWLLEQIRQKAAHLNNNFEHEARRLERQLLKEALDAARAGITKTQIGKAEGDGHEAGSSQSAQRSAEEAAQELAQTQAQGPADTRGDAHEPARAIPGEFNPADLERDSAPGGGEPRPGGIDAQLKEAVKDFVQDESGHLDLERLREFALHHGQRLKKYVRYVREEFSKLAGKMAPTTTRLDRETGEALTRMNAAPVYARMQTPMFIDKVLGPKASPQDRLIAGAVLTERRLRYMKQAYRQAGDQAAAQAVTSIIGKQGSPFQSFDAYRSALQSPKIQEMLRNWEREFVPTMEDNFRRAQGLEESDPISSFTQIPGSPVNLKPVSAESAGPTTVFTTARGDLRRVKLGKLKFAEQATGTADAYDLDLGAIIENSLVHGTTQAAKAEFMRTAVENGVASWEKPGAKVEGARIIPGVSPPRFTQAAKKNQTALAVHEDAYPEVHQALQLEDPARIPVVSDLAPIFTRATLLSSVEVMTHTKNLLTALMKPGVRPQDFVSNVYGVFTKQPWATQRLVELARIGAMKEEGIEMGELANQGLRRFDPLHWGGRFLDFAQKIMRLTLDDAFSRMDRQGLVVNTETNRRDFVNQLGQYLKKAQQKFIVWLRDTQIGPFATAGSNYAIQGVRAVTMNPGADATSFRAAAQMRAEMLGKTLALLTGGVWLTNYLLWGRPGGDDNTPFGNIKIYTDKDGYTHSFGLMSLTGLSRGMRQLGLMAMSEGLPRGQMAGQIADKTFDNFVDSWMHVGAGPIVSFSHTTLTGRNMIGMNVAEKAEPGESQRMLNLRAAIRNANPLLLGNPVSSLLTGQEPHRQGTWGESLNQAAGPYGMRISGGYVHDVNRLFSELAGPRAHALRHVQSFEREEEYQVVSHAHQAMLQIDHALNGLRPSGNRLISGPAPLENVQEQLRDRQRDIARRALEEVRRISARQSAGSQSAQR